MDAAYASQPISWALLLWLQLSLPVTATAQAQATATAQVQTTATQTAIAMLTAAPTITPTRQATVSTPDCDYEAVYPLGYDFVEMGEFTGMENIRGSHTIDVHIDVTPQDVYNRILDLSEQTLRSSAFWSLNSANELIGNSLGDNNTSYLTTWLDSAIDGDTEEFFGSNPVPVLNSNTVTVFTQNRRSENFHFTNTTGYGFYGEIRRGRVEVFPINGEGENGGIPRPNLTTTTGVFMCAIYDNPHMPPYPFIIYTAFPSS
jgi:hypothetical protein